MIIKPNDITDLLGQHLQGMTDIPEVVWPNRYKDPPRPFIVFTHVPINTFDGTLDGTGARSTGYISLSVVTDTNVFAAPAGDLVGEIMEHFPYGLELDGGYFTITINQPPKDKKGYRDGPDWRQPVEIYYDAET